MSKKEKFDKFLKNDNVFSPIPIHDISDKLEPGMYSSQIDEWGRVYFTKMELAFDEIVDLPSGEYDFIVKEMEHFLKPETQNLFNQYNFVYKRSTLLYGLPGTGKTVIVNRIAQHIIKLGGVVLFNPDPDDLSTYFEVLDSIQPDTKLLVVFEEIDETLRHSEQALLHLLDGEVQKNNVIYMATTNHIDRVPDRIIRPGRFSTVLEIKYPDRKAREHYLTQKLKLNPEMVEELTEKTDGLSIDEIKEVVVSRVCLGQGSDFVIQRIKKLKNNSKPKTAGFENDQVIEAFTNMAKAMRKSKKANGR